MSLPEKIIEAFALVVICVGAIAGNVLLFLVVKNCRRLRTKGNFFVLNLAFADLMVSIINMPVTLVTVISEEWILGQKLCQASGFLSLLTLVASCMTLTTISINRYYAVVRWPSYRVTFSTQRCILYAAVTWTVTIWLSILPFFGWASFGFNRSQSYCFVEWSESKTYTIFMIMACLLGPVVIMSYCYINIIRCRRKSRRVLQVNETPSAILSSESTPRMLKPNRSKADHVDRKLTRLSLLLILVFAFCWSPFAIVMLVDVYADAQLPRALAFGSLIVGYMNSFCNVFVYSGSNKLIRHQFAKWLGFRRSGNGNG